METCVAMLKIHQREVQWKQGVVVYIILRGCFIIPPSTAPPSRLHPPLMNTQETPGGNGNGAPGLSIHVIYIYIYIWTLNYQSLYKLYTYLSIYLSIYIYIYIHIYIYIYIFQHYTHYTDDACSARGSERTAPSRRRRRRGFRGVRLLQGLTLFSFLFILCFSS